MSETLAAALAIPVGTVIHGCLMYRTHDVLSEDMGCLVLLAADVALVATSIPG